MALKRNKMVALKIIEHVGHEINFSEEYRHYACYI